MSGLAPVESHRAHSGTSVPTSPCVTVGSFVSSPTLSAVTFQVTNPTFPSRSLSASRCRSPLYSTDVEAVPDPVYVKIEPAHQLLRAVAKLPAHCPHPHWGTVVDCTSTTS
jgi:hypothetical protein